MKILIATGGSGGHIFPASHLARELKKRGHEVVFAGPLGRFKGSIIKQGFRVWDMKGMGFSRESLIRIIRFFTFMFQAMIKSFQIIGQERPDAVIGFGGYGAFPLVFMATLRRVPVMIHEQNVVMGRANKILSEIGIRVALSFKDSLDLYDFSNVVVTGCPALRPLLNADVITAKGIFGLEDDLQTILVLGGSQGSHRVNKVFLETLDLIKTFLDFQVIHVAGEKDEDSVRQMYSQSGIKAGVYSFLDNLDQAYLAADLIISRAGAVSVTEIMNFGKQAFIVPYPYAGGHQFANAEVVSRCGLAEVIREEELSPQLLREKIEFWFNNRLSSSARQKIAENIIGIEPVALLADEVIGLIKK